MGQCHRSYSLKQKCHPLGDEIYLVNDIAICLPRVAIHRPIVLFEAKKRRGHVWQRGRERAVRGQSPLHTKRRTKTKPLSAHPRWVHYLVASATEKGPAAEPADGFAQRSSGTPSISTISRVVQLREDLSSALDRHGGRTEVDPESRMGGNDRVLEQRSILAGSCIRNGSLTSPRRQWRREKTRQSLAKKILTLRLLKWTRDHDLTKRYQPWHL